jgi:hypothetical protein
LRADGPHLTVVNVGYPRSIGRPGRASEYCLILYDRPPVGAICVHDGYGTHGGAQIKESDLLTIVRPIRKLALAKVPKVSPIRVHGVDR